VQKIAKKENLAGAIERNPLGELLQGLPRGPARHRNTVAAKARRFAEVDIGHHQALLIRPPERPGRVQSDRQACQVNSEGQIGLQPSWILRNTLFI
jgi:hypothetical protein